MLCIHKQIHQLAIHTYRQKKAHIYDYKIEIDAVSFSRRRIPTSMA